MAKKKQSLTTNAGAPVVDNQNIMTAGPRDHALLRGRLFSCGDAPQEVKLRHLGNCHEADPAYATGVAKALKIGWKAPR